MSFGTIPYVVITIRAFERGKGLLSWMDTSSEYKKKRTNYLKYN